MTCSTSLRVQAFLVLALAPALLALSVVEGRAYETFTLPNGLQVLLAPDHSIPVVTMGWGVPVGSRQEVPGRSGFAHLFEHLTFQGSANVPRGGFDRMLERFGADSNAFTAIDRTYYYARLPAHAWTTVLWVDADRLSTLDVSAKSLRNQVDVVKEERRQNVDGEAYSPLLNVEVSSRMFSNWANSHNTYGSFADLDAAKLADARAFFAAHYAPREIRLVLAGDFDPAFARQELTRYLGWIPNRAAPAPPVPTDEPARAGGRSFSVKDANASLPGSAFVWRVDPVRGSRERWAMALLGRYLCAGPASRLRLALVKEAKAASSVDHPHEGGLGFPTSDAEDFRAPGLFGFFVLRRPEVSSARLKELVAAEMSRVVAEGIPAAALARVKARLAGDGARERETSSGRAGALVRAWQLDGDADVLAADVETAMTITGDETREAASRWLAPEAMDVFELEPGR